MLARSIYHSAHDENFRHALLNLLPLSFTIRAENIIKMIGFKFGAGERAAKTGTSVHDRLCITGAMGPCIA